MNMKTKKTEGENFGKKYDGGAAASIDAAVCCPLLIGNLLQQTYNIIDAAIVGRILGTGALASVGASSSVQFLVLGFCIGSCVGFGVPVAKSFGAGKYGEMRDYIFNAMALTGVLAVLMTVVCALLCPWILHILSVPEEIYENAYQYLLIIFLGLPFTLLYNLLSGILRSVGDSRTPFIFLAVSTVMNIVLDLFCIVVLKWGCAGAAAATVAAQAVSGILCLIYIWKRVGLLKPERSNCRVRGRAVRDLIAMGVPMGLQYSITAIGSMVMQAANNSLGSVYVSGFTAGVRLKQLTMCPFDAIATAVSVFCGQNLGAGKTDRIKKVLTMELGLPFLWCCGWSGIGIRRKNTFHDLYKQRGGRCIGCLCAVSAVHGIFLLVSGNFECMPYEYTGTRLFRENDDLRRAGDDCQMYCQSCFC